MIYSVVYISLGEFAISTLALKAKPKFKYIYLRGMQYQRLGKSDLNVSRISFGCMSLGENDPGNMKILHRAIDLGVNFFDTADLYGKGMNEVSVGKALRGKRKDVIIASKAGNQWREDGSGWDWNPRKEYILSCIDRSLQRLQTDYIDLYQLHGGTLDDPIDETIEAFELLQQQGKIRYYGISSIRPNVIREYIRRSNIVSVMMQYSLLDRRPEEEALIKLKEHNIGVLTRGSVAQGLLIDKPVKEYLGYSTADVAKATKAVHAASNENRTAAQTALQFVLKHPSITSVVAGIRTPEQLEEIAASLDVPLLNEEEYEALRNAIPANRYEQHR
jgi:aryl-alcohol dehydrogenase-like predicted oxidoreductase